MENTSSPVEGPLTRFPLGKIVTTKNAFDKLNPEDVVSALSRHRRGNWGELNDKDKEMNQQALENGNRIFSTYRDRKGTKFWIITEADRSVTTVLFPEEY